MSAYAQRRDAVLNEAFVAHMIKPALACDPGQLVFELWKVGRLAHLIAQAPAYLALCLGTRASDDDGVDSLDRLSLSRASFIEVGLPLCGILNGILQEILRLRCRTFISQGNEFPDPAVIVDEKSAHIDADPGIRVLERATLVLHDHHVDGARKNAGQRIEFLDLAGRQG